MTRYEYKVVPAPQKGLRGKGVKGAEGKFANALENVMNKMGADGWEYQRAETLPSEERAGLASKTITYRHLLVFRRPAIEDASVFEPALLDPPETTLDEIEADPVEPEESPEDTHTETDDREDDTRL